MTELLVRRDDLRELRFVDGAPGTGEVAPGTVRLRVECFGLTANNVTYGVTGDTLGYWRFFPADDGWGRIPVWGFARVEDSGVEGIAAGERFYGYLPMATEVTMEARATGSGFADASAGRSDLPRLYNRYLRAEGPGFAPEHDAANVVLRPLFSTGWLIADQLEEAGFHDADAVIVVSASSKTGYAAAWSLQRLEGAPRVVGLTSGRNAGFVAGLGVVDEVLPYGREDALAGERVAVVDLAGDPSLVEAIARHADVRATIVVGATHWDAAAASAFATTPEFFFAPARIDDRAAAWGPAVLQQRLGAAWVGFVPEASRTLEVRTSHGIPAAAEVLRTFVDGTADPRAAHVVVP